MDQEESIVVAGATYGSLPGQISAGSADAFVRKYDSEGNVEWTRQFGTSGAETVYAVAAGEEGSIVVVGYTQGAFSGYTNLGSVDAFVRKYDSEGNVEWTRQFGTSGSDYTRGVALDEAGNIVITGETGGTLPGQTGAGSLDAFVRKYDSEGNIEWTRQFGSTATNFARAVAVGERGSIVVVGYTPGILPGQMSVGYTDAFVRKYDAEGNLEWTRQFGTDNADLGHAVVVDEGGNVVVVGDTNGAFPGQRHRGGFDAFVRMYDAEGNEGWNLQFGSNSDDQARAVARSADGSIVVVGYTEGTLPGQTSEGRVDAFVVKLVP